MSNSTTRNIGQRFQELIKHIATGMVLCRTDGSFLIVNQAFCTLTGYSEKELLKITFKDITHAEDLSDDLENIDLILKGKIDNYKIQKRYIRKDKTIIWVHLTVSLIRDDQNEPVCFIGTVEDITSQKIAQKAIEFSEEKFEKAFMSSSDAIMISSFHDGRYIDVNETFLTLSGYTREEIIGKSSLELNIWDDKKARDLFIEIFRKEGKVRNFEAVYRAKNRNTGIVSMSADLIKIEDEVCILTQSRDITQLKKVEDRLRMSSLATETSSSAIFAVDLKGRITYANTTAATMWGYKNTDEMINTHVIDYWTESSRQKAEDLKNIILEEGYSTDLGSLIAQHKNGSEFIVETRAVTIKNEKGKPVGMIGSFTDITNRIKAEEEIRRSEEKFAKLFESSPDAITLSGMEDKLITDVNESACRITGYSKEELIGQAVLSTKFWVNEYELEKYKQLLGKNNKVNNFEARLRMKSGEIRTTLVSGEIISIQGELYILGIIRDITERKHAQAELKEERTLLRTLIDNLPSGIFVKNKEYKKIIINPEHLNEVRNHLKVLGMNSNIKLLNLTDFEVFPKELAEKFFIDDQKVIRDGESIINKVELGINPDGKKNWFLVSKVPLYDKDGEISGMVGITTDITAQKEIEEELRKAKVKAEESDKLKTIFLANMSHEVRTPLNSILGFSELLEEDDLTKRQKADYIELIQNSGRRLMQLIQDIIDISQIEAKQLSLFKQNHLIYDIVKQSIRIFRNSKILKFKNEVKLRLKYPKKYQNIVTYTDDIRLQQVLDNLIVNAIKYTEKGFVEVGLEIIKKKENDYLQFYVKDTGQGIPGDKRELIFKRFRQAEEQSYHEGTGLGLSISKGIVELLGGEIWLNSELNKGSTFYFTIPYTKGKDKSTVTSEMPESKKIDIKNKTFIIADDDYNSYLLINELLSKQGATVLYAEDGVELMHMLEKKTPDVILLDINMPLKSGFECMTEIKEKEVEVKVIAQTAYTMNDEKLRCYKAGCDGYISKPVKQDELFSLISQILSENEH